MELKGIGYLRNKLTKKAPRVLLRYKYYDMKARAKDFQISTPPNLRWTGNSLGWCAKAVDSLANRLTFTGFKNDNFNLEQIFLMNNPDILVPSAIKSALIASCSFVYISPDENGVPRLQVIDGANATGVLDPITYLLQEGYAVLERDDNQKAILEAYFEPGAVTYYENGVETDKREYACQYPLLVPIINRPDARRPFGHSQISRACMDIQDSAVRTMKRSEISAEFYSFPQRYATGLSQDAEKMDSWRATVSTMLTFSKDDDGDKPQLGQFQQQSMSPHVDQLRMFAAMFGGETGLTMDDLGFPQANPSSAEAIKASHEQLRLTARAAQRTFGSGLLNVGFLAACLRDEYQYKRKAFYETDPTWAPVFEPDAAMLSAMGDGIMKLSQAVPDYISGDVLYELTGIKGKG